jgi:hypothetical protein
MIEINFIQLAVLITTRMSVGIRARKEASAVLTPVSGAIFSEHKKRASTWPAPSDKR